MQNGKEYLNESVKKELSYEAVFPKGNYTVSLIAVNDAGKSLNSISFNVYECGDTNNDGTVSTADLVLLSKWLMTEENELPAWQNADLNADGVLDVYDLVLLRKLITK